MYSSRFFTIDDAKSDHFFFDLHPTWWSRIYEYPWAGGFAEKKDICLDAACGVSHPLKFYLYNHCQEVYANDIDKRLVSRNEMLKEIKENFGDKAFLDMKYSTNIKYSVAAITNLPYSNNFFDKIYCISVLEHLRDHFNKRKVIKPAKVDNFLGNFYRKDIFKSFLEFKRVLKPGGLIILTFDYPIINLEYFKEIVAISGLKFVENPSFTKNENAIYSSSMKLNCYRAVLTK